MATSPPSRPLHGRRRGRSVTPATAAAKTARLRRWFLCGSLRSPPPSTIWTCDACSRWGISAWLDALRDRLSRRTLLLLSPTTGHGGAEEYIVTVADAAAAAGWRVGV